MPEASLSRASLEVHNATALQAAINGSVASVLTLVGDGDRRECPIQRDLEGLRAGDHDFLIYAYCGTKIVRRLGAGSGDAAALRERLEPDNVNYALLCCRAAPLAKALGRTVPQDVVVFITWFPPGISPMTRGAVASHRAAVHAVFEPFQLEITAEAGDDLEKIDAKVAAYVEGTF